MRQFVPDLVSVPMMRRCRGCRTVKRVKAFWLGNAMAMMHYLRIVNAGGRQKWHGDDHKDKVPPDSAWHTPPRQYARVKAYSMLPLKSLRVLPAEPRTRKLPQTTA